MARIGTGGFNVKVVTSAVQQALDVGKVTVSKYESWRIKKMREMAAPSIVIMGVGRAH